MKYKNIVTIGILALVTIVLALISATRNEPNLLLDVAPDGATVTIDGKPIEAGSVYATPGDHTLEASLNGFSTVKQTVTVKNNEVATVELLLNPNSQAGLDYLIANPEEQLHREALGGKKFARAVEDNENKNPLIQYLPFIDRLYRVDYGASIKNPDDPDAAAIFITYFEDSAKQDAIDWIKFKGIDPASLEIIYVNDNVPLEDD